jgi:hypothetical protein
LKIYTKPEFLDFSSAAVKYELQIDSGNTETKQNTKRLFNAIVEVEFADSSNNKNRNVGKTQFKYREVDQSVKIGKELVLARNALEKRIDMIINVKVTAKDVEFIKNVQKF